MTVSSTTRKAGPFSGNGSTTSFPFSFKIYTKNDIAVYLTNSLGAISTLVLDSDYSVSVNANQDTTPGGTVTYPISGSALPTGSTLTINGNMAYSQSTQLPSGGAYNAQNVEQAFDRVTILTQQLLEAINRAVQLPVSTSLSSASLPTPAATNLLGWNNTATALQNYDAGALGVAIAYAEWRTQLFSGNGVITTFVLSYDAGNASNIDLRLNGVPQTPGVNFTYTASTKTITFTVAPSSGTNNIVARYGEALPLGTLTDGSVTDAKLATDAVTTTKIINDAVTTAKILNGAVTAAKMATGAAASNIGYTPANDTAVMHLAGAETATGAKRGTVVALTDAATITPDFSAGNNFSVTLGGNRTLANPSNQTAGQAGIIVVTQDGTGSRTLAYGSNWKFPSGTAPTLTTTASAVDVIAYYVESATRITARWIGDVK